MPQIKNEICFLNFMGCIIFRSTREIKRAIYMRWNNAGRKWQMTRVSDVAAVHHCETRLAALSSAAPCSGTVEHF